MTQELYFEDFNGWHRPSKQQSFDTQVMEAVLGRDASQQIDIADNQVTPGLGAKLYLLCLT